MNEYSVFYSLSILQKNQRKGNQRKSLSVEKRIHLFLEIEPKLKPINIFSEDLFLLLFLLLFNLLSFCYNQRRFNEQKESKKILSLLTMMGVFPFIHLNNLSLIQTKDRLLVKSIYFRLISNVTCAQVPPSYELQHIFSFPKYYLNYLKRF